MIKTLDQILTESQIKSLISHFVYKKELDVSSILEKMTKDLSYEMRKHSHSATAKNRIFTEDELEHIVWNYYIKHQIKDGLTTGDLARKTGKSLEFVNSFF